MDATELNRLRWRCRRGMLENDLILARFLDARGEAISDVEGGSLRLTAGSICVHGDTAGAVGIARRVREALAGAGITLAPFVT